MSNSITSTANFKNHKDVTTGTKINKIYNSLIFGDKMRYRLMILSLLLFFSSCETDNTQAGTEYPNFLGNIEGVVQKGPFINGTAVTISEFNDKLIPTGINYQATIKDNIGSFIVKSVSLSSPFVSLSANGYFFNEITGKKTGSQITLYALSEVKSDRPININIFSHIEKERVEYLVNNGKTFSAAKKQAAEEILNIFYITEPITSSENLDISKSANENAILLAISVMLLGDQSEGDFTEFMSNISTDIRTDGVLNSATLFDKILTNAKALKLTTIRYNLENRYKELGISATIGNFEMYIMNFINSSQKVVPYIHLNWPYKSTVFGLAQKFEGTITTPFHSKITIFKIDCNGDGVWDMIANGKDSKENFSFNYTFSTYGDYTYTIYAEDEYGKSITKKSTLSVSNIEAKTNITGDTNILAGDTSFLSISINDDDTIERVYIDFGEGNLERPRYDTITGLTEFTISHQYPDVSYFTQYPEQVTKITVDEYITFPLNVIAVDKYGNEMTTSLLVKVHSGIKKVVYVSKDGSDKNDGTSWSNALASPQHAFVKAKYGYSEIWIAEGIYTNKELYSQMFSFAFVGSPHEINIYGGFNGNESDKTQRNSMMNRTILSGDINNNDIDNNLDGFTDIQGNVVDSCYVNTILIGKNVLIDGLGITGGFGGPFGGNSVVTNNGKMRECTIAGNTIVNAYSSDIGLEKPVFSVIKNYGLIETSTIKHNNSIEYAIINEGIITGCEIDSNSYIYNVGNISDCTIANTPRLYYNDNSMEDNHILPTCDSLILIVE